MPFKKTQFDLEKPTLARTVSPPKWESIVEAVTSLDKKAIKKYAVELKGLPLNQEGVTIPELQKQILDMAPGEHPALGHLLLDLAGRL